jgi:hypothetical protein
MRLRQRRKVDFPQPEGPMNAVTAPEMMGMVTSRSTFFVP